MEGKQPQPHLWAILIGVDNYDTGPLRGAVRDVKIFAHHLERNYGFADIQVLTASQPSQAIKPPNEQEDLPTKKNIISRFDTIAKEARAGDFVHVHFSGHGTQIKSARHEYSNEESGDLLLVLHDDVGDFYMNSIDLADQLKILVDKKLLVTVLLDCCFSGSVIRQENDNVTVRTQAYNPHVHNSSKNQGQSDAKATTTDRDARTIKNTLLDPKGYAIITSCNPYEESGEIEVDGEFHGALSFMLDTVLKSYGGNATYFSLYENVRSQFDSRYSWQNPMFLGNQDIPFFGKALIKPDVLSVCLFTRDGCFHIVAGAAHGVQMGDKYVVYPSNVDKTSSSLCEPAITGTVIEVRGLNSSLGFNSGSDSCNVKTGWRAKPIQLSAPRRIPVRIHLQDHNNEQETAFDDGRLWRSCSIDPTGPPCDFTVEHRREEYQISGASGRRMCPIPPIPHHEASLGEEIMGQLKHLATYKCFERIHNEEPSGAFESSFEVNLQDEGGRSFRDPGFADHHEKQTLSLSIQNNNDTQDLYVSMFDLGPLYQIEELSLSDKFFVVRRNKGRKLAVGMTIPEGYGLSTCDDVIKVFVTSQPTLFTQFWLPPITESKRNFAKDNSETAQKLENRLDLTERGVRAQGYDPLAEDWQAFNFHVRSVAENYL